MKEFKSVRQIPGEPFRRWYSDSDNDLIVWLDQYEIIGFQLIVPCSSGRTVITWRKGERPTVAGLDDGEARPGRTKMTPILIDADAVDVDDVIRRFKAVSEDLSPGLAELVAQKIVELAQPARGVRAMH
jgi:hypothetical protein